MNNEEKNTETYERAWSAPVGAMRLPDRVWYEVKKILPKGPLLEIGAGVKPSIPIKKNYFLDISEASIKKINARGGIGKVGSALSTGFETGFFKGVFAFEMFEHVEDDVKALLEAKRILADDGLLVFSVPVFMKHWTGWDEMATHVRRYEPDELMHKLFVTGFEPIKFKTRKSVARKWSVSFPILFNKKYPNAAMFITQYFAFYPTRALNRFKKIRWTEGPEIALKNSAAGITIIARKRNI